MIDATGNGRPWLRPVLWIGGIVLLIFCGGVLAGITAGYLKDGARGWRGVALIVAAMLPVAALVAAGVADRRRQDRRRQSGDPAAAPPPGPRERANHRLLMISGAIGGVIGLVTAIAVLGTQRGGPDHAPPSLLSAPLPPWLAILIALVWGVVVPVISWRWHQVVDEHERDAYRDGAVAGFYVIGIGAPVWWFLWRGGLAPAVDPVWLYAATMAVTGGVWLWRKYQ